MDDYQFDSLGYALRMKLMTPDDRLREWALHRASLKTIMLVSFARTACMQALRVAEKEGREFTPIYWYFAGMKTPPVMTLWDMNER